jgi:hypothetical protein
MAPDETSPQIDLLKKISPAPKTIPKETCETSNQTVWWFAPSVPHLPRHLCPSHQAVRNANKGRLRECITFAHHANTTIKHWHCHWQPLFY